MPNYETEQLSALLMYLIDKHGHNTDRLIQGIEKKLPEYFIGDQTKRESNKIILTRMNDEFKLKEVGIIEIYEEDLRGNFPSSSIEKLKVYKHNNSLDFAFLIYFDSNNHIKIKEVNNNNINFLTLDYNS